MRSRRRRREVLRALALLSASLAAVLATGCGTPGAPQPPSLHLPQPVQDLAAARNGDQVALTWTMPKRDTSKVTLIGAIAVKICRREGDVPCATAATVSLEPGASGSFTDRLPAALTAGDPRPLNYTLELLNKRDRSAGPSNTAAVLAGQAPAAVADLRADLRKDGIVLHWTPGPPEPYATVVRLERTLLTPQPAKAEQGPLATPPEPVKQNLLVPVGGVRGRVLDKDIRFGESYEYRAQRVAQVTVNGKQIELDGPFSSPVRMDAQNVFPPAVPSGLAAVAMAAGNGTGPAVDLSWQPDSDADLAGYVVFRREADQPDVGWQRVSPAQPVIGPGFHDPSVQAGHTYEYAVTAIGQNGRESERSAAAQETVPEQ